VPFGIAIKLTVKTNVKRSINLNITKGFLYTKFTSIYPKKVFIYSEQQKQIRAQWETKFETQPFTIIDNSWKSSEFVQVGHTAKGAVLSYNSRHPFHKELYKIKEIIEKNNNPEDTIKAAKKLSSLIDLLLISYCKSELAFDYDDEMSPEELVEDLRMNWGRFLERYLKKINDND
jgi:hypothetical protein